MKFIIPVLVGAIIGYITNWLAIKMLFRPYEEKRILGVRIPFTPGLIPKERGRIAKKVGEVVGEYLLSPEVIMNWISENNIEGYIEEWIASKISNLKREDRSLKEFIKNYDGILNNIKRKIADFICIEIKRDKFKEGVIKLIKKYLLPRSMDYLYEFTEEKLKASISNLITSNKVKNLLRDAMEKKLRNLARDKRKLKEFIPIDLIHEIKGYIKDQDEYIVKILRDMLDDPSIEKEIKASINSLLSQYMNRIISLFISPEAISNKVYVKIKEYAYEPEFNEKVIDVLMILIDKVMENNVSSVVGEVMSKLGEDEMTNISNWIIGIISDEENMNKVVDIIEENIKAKETEIQNNLLRIITDQLEKVLDSEDLYEKIYRIIDNIIERIIDEPVSSIFKYLDTTFIDEVTDLIMDILNRFIGNRLPQLLRIINVSQIVEDEINGYDVAFAEELIVQVAQRELRAITWLGGLLGAIIGLLTPLLQMI